MSPRQLLVRRILTVIVALTLGPIVGLIGGIGIGNFLGYGHAAALPAIFLIPVTMILAGVATSYGFKWVVENRNRNAAFNAKDSDAKDQTSSG